MSNVTIIKDETGKLRGIDPVHDRKFRRLRREVADLPVGQTMGLSFRLARSPGHHRKFFLKMSRLLDRTETFSNTDDLRRWATVGAGYFDLIPGLDGKPNAIPQSIDFDTLDEAAFSELHRAVDEFLMTDRALLTLWPELPPAKRLECAESFVREFM